MASLKKIRKILPAFTHEEVKNKVEQAFSSDEAGRDKILADLKAKGIDKEIAICLIELVKEQDTLSLSNGDFTYLREYFALLGVESSVSLFKDLLKSLLSLDVSQEYNRRNICLLIEYLLFTVNILSHGKLREAVKEDLPVAVANLWEEEGTRGASVFLARQLVYILLLERDYIEVDDKDVLAVWKKITSASKSLKKEPVIILLTVLLHLEPNVKDTAILSGYSFPSHDMHKENELSPFAQFADIVRLHKQSLLIKLDLATATNVLQQALKYALAKTTEDDNVLDRYLEELMRCRELAARSKLTPQLITSALLGAIEDQADPAIAFKACPWLKELRTISNDNSRKPEQVFDFLSNVVKKELTYDTTNENVHKSFSNGPDCLKWPNLLNVQKTAPTSLKPLLFKLKPEKCTKLLMKAGKQAKQDQDDVIAVARVLLGRIPQDDFARLPDFLIQMVEVEEMPTSILSLCADLVRLVAAKPEERKIVTLSLSIATTFNEINFNADAMFSMEILLHNCLRYAHPSITNDQVAVYSHLVTKHFRGVQFFAQLKKASDDIIDRLKYGCFRIANQICQHEVYFSRVVCSIISETILGYQYIESAMYKLHSINDKHSSSLLATAMPPAEKRQYSRVFPEIKKSLKRVL